MISKIQKMLFGYNFLYIVQKFLLNFFFSIFNFERFIIVLLLLSGDL